MTHISCKPRKGYNFFYMKWNTYLCKPDRCKVQLYTVCDNFSYFSCSVAPRINLTDTHYVDRGQAASLYCQVKGYPSPTISWTPCNPLENVCDNSFLNISKVQESAEIYTCTAENSLGKKSASTDLGKLSLSDTMHLHLLSDTICMPVHVVVIRLSWSIKKRSQLIGSQSKLKIPNRSTLIIWHFYSHFRVHQQNCTYRKCFHFVLLQSLEAM